MSQTWLELLFAHWKVPVEHLQKQLPASLELDLYEGCAYLGVVPFRMSDVKLRGTPSVPGLSEFLELNVRTYVTVGGVPGVYFFSLDASNAIAVRIARAWYHLPYYDAKMALDFHSTEAGSGIPDGKKRTSESEWVLYSSTRSGAANNEAIFEAIYRPQAAIEYAKPGSLEAFLTERYCLYVGNRQGRMCRGEIHHKPWPLQLAEARISKNTMGQRHGFDLSSEEPILHYSSRIDTIEWPIKPID